jgi:hypothetical protein
MAPSDCPHRCAPSPESLITSTMFSVSVSTCRSAGAVSDTDACSVLRDSLFDVLGMV